MTPEGKVKQKVVQALRRAEAAGKRLWWCRPVTFGFSTPLLDFIGCANGHFFAVETKAPGGKLTPRQVALAKRLRDVGAKVFVVVGGDDASLATFIAWLEGQE